jgi:hypothetical protein
MEIGIILAVAAIVSVLAFFLIAEMLRTRRHRKSAFREQFQVQCNECIGSHDSHCASACGMPD